MCDFIFDICCDCQSGWTYARSFARDSGDITLSLLIFGLSLAQQCCASLGDGPVKTSSVA
jgi:hypothetical protein